MATFVLKNNGINLPKSDKIFEGSVRDYDGTYTLTNKVLKVMGVRMTVKDTKFAKFCWNLYFWFTYINVVIALILETMNMLQTATGGTFLDLFTVMPCVGYVIVALTKAYKIKVHMAVLENLANELRDMWPNGRIPADEHHLLTLAITRLKFFVGAYFSCTMVLGFIFVAPTVYAYVIRSLGHDVPLILPLGYWLPFDPIDDSPHLYVAVMSVMACHCFQSVLLMLAGDLLLIIFLSHVNTQFSLLAVRINKLFYVPIDNQLLEEYPLGEVSIKLKLLRDRAPPPVDDDPEKRIQEELVLIIKRHRALIRLSSDIESKYTYSMLVNFMNSSVIICFCLFCVAFVEKWTEFTYKVFFITAISQTGILCWLGQQMKDTSTDVTEALFNCGWYVASHSIKKSILIMIHRSQKEVHITTYGFSIISLESYATILKTSWSYFTLLINMYKD